MQRNTCRHANLDFEAARCDREWDVCLLEGWQRAPPSRFGFSDYTGVDWYPYLHVWGVVLQ
jgi:hypothetical protein